jgi:peptidoglycan/LPS O-acetylase OafA/YrhL
MFARCGAAAKPVSSVAVNASFRPDVEGLRAVAIGLVIVAHAGVPFAAGGYVGVDVFFVISGFLITRLLIAEIDRTQRISLTTFYGRRIKRLLPQAVLVVTVVVIGSWALLSPIRARDVSHDVMAAGGYLINWHFAAQSADYFSTGDADRPLDHFWSLAVEEQYYVVWPLLLLLVTRPWRRRPASARRALAFTLAAIIAFSLLYAAHVVASTPTQAYFSTPARAWELGLGGLLAVAPLSRVPPALAACVAWCGFAAIVAATLAFGPATPVPGPAALVPTVGAGALITAGAQAHRPLPARWLGVRPMQALGRMSYAWYVWHWPVLVFAAEALGPLSLLEALAVAAASLVPAVVTYRWIEQPVRRSDVHRRRPRLTLAAAPVAASLIVVLGLGLAALEPAIPTSSASEAIGAAQLGGRRGIQESAAALRPAPQDADADRSRAYYDGCLVGKREERSPACVYGDPTAAETVVVFGDSHAMQYFPAIERIARQRHWRLVELTKSGCPAARVRVRDYLLGRAYTECDAWREYALRRIADEHPQQIITSGTATYAVLAGGHRLGHTGSRAALVAGYKRVFAQLRKLAGTVIAIHDTPQPPFDVPSCVAGALDHLRRCAFPKRVGRPPGDPISVAARAAGVRLLDPVDQLCVRALCPAVIGNVLVYRQSGHLTATYAATMTPWFDRHIPAPGGRATA